MSNSKQKTVNTESNTVNFLFHEKQLNKKGERRTFAAVIKDNSMQIGISICGKRDQFEKSKGRLIAAGRANKKPSTVLTIENNTDLRQLFFDAVRSL